MNDTHNASILLSATVTGLLFCTSAIQAASVTYDFVDGGTLDGSVAGSTMVVTENGETLTLSTVQIQGPDFGEFSPFGNVITLASGETNISGSDLLGINNNTVNNSGYEGITGISQNESSYFNYLESWSFEFDKDVTFETIDFAVIGSSGEYMRVNVEGNTTNYDFANGNSGDVFSDPFSGLVITAGTNITFTALTTATTDPEDTVSLGVEDFTVTVVPEPSSSALLGLGGLALVLRRRR